MAGETQRAGELKKNELRSATSLYSGKLLFSYSREASFSTVRFRFAKRELRDQQILVHFD